MPFPVSVGLLPTAPSSGITASKKGIAISAILGGWDRKDVCVEVALPFQVPISGITAPKKGTAAAAAAAKLLQSC